MRAICVDDEVILLKVLKNAIEQSPDITNVVDFSSAHAAIEFAKNNPVEIAFLDIEIHRMSGIELAAELRKIHPNMFVVFCTGYSQYALDAFKIHANGYLTKPIYPEDVQEQIDTIKKIAGIDDTNKLVIHCFGNFEAFVKGKPLRFKLSRTKEMLAYLVDRNGAECKTAEIISTIFEDVYNTDYYSKLRRDLIKTFEENGISDCLVLSYGGIAINRDVVQCDYFDYLDGKITTPPNEYMSQYSFAEVTFGELLN